MATTKTFEKRITEAGFTAMQASKLERVLTKKASGNLRLPDDVSIISLINGILENGDIDIEQYIIKKPRTMSEATKQKNYKIQLKKLQERYGIVGGNE